MKKKDSDLTRFKNLLAKNKYGLGDKFESLFYMDLCGVLGDYFDISGDPLINIEKKQGGYTVNVMFNAKSAKKINTVID